MAFSTHGIDLSFGGCGVVGGWIDSGRDDSIGQSISRVCMVDAAGIDSILPGSASGFDFCSMTYSGFMSSHRVLPMR